MATLLHVDSSPMGMASISRHLTAEFVQNWKRANSTGAVITRDLTITSIAPIAAEWVGAVYTPADSRSEAQREVLAPSDELIRELRSADEYIIGVPMHNFGVPSKLKLWIDLIVRAGETFSYGQNGPVGLLTNKKAAFMDATGGGYGEDAAMASFNFVEPYLRTIFGFIGVSNTRFLSAGGVAALMAGKVDRQIFLQPHIESIRTQFQLN